MVEEVIEQLGEAIRAIAEVDLDTLDDSELDSLVVGLVRARHRLAGATAGPLARWDTAGVWRTDGSRSAGTRLARDCSTSTTTAHVELRRARALRDMPVTAAAVTDGRISMDHVDLLARADRADRHDLFARDEAMLVDQCATLRHTHAVRAVEYWTQLADSRRR